MTRICWRLVVALTPLALLAAARVSGGASPRRCSKAPAPPARTRATARSRGARSRDRALSRAQDKLPPFVEGDSNRPEVKVLYVHGIGTHAPGHGTALRQNLATSLGLEIRAPRPKRIVIAHPDFPDQNLGEINVSRLTDAAASARPPVLRADLVADHPARQGPARLRQGAGLRPAARGGEPGDAQLRQRHRPRSPGLRRAETRADPGLGRPVDLLGCLAQLERAARADREHALRPGPPRHRQPGRRWTTSSSSRTAWAAARRSTRCSG